MYTSGARARRTFVRPPLEHDVNILQRVKNRDCIINVGNGYYRPTKGDPLEESELNHYLNADLHRADEIMTRVDSMREAFYGRY